jgi:hypothetical protein
MATRLMKCPVSKLEVGMMIAQDTLVGNGSLVLDAGTKVDQDCINMLNHGKIQYVIVEVNVSETASIESEKEEVSKPTSPPPQKKEQWVNKKKLMFRDCINDRFMGKLYRIVCDSDGEE